MRLVIDEIYLPSKSRERRRSRRLPIKWPIEIQGTDDRGISVREESRVENLSAAGVFFYLSRRLLVGSKVIVQIKLPLAASIWVRYAGEVVRTQNIGSRSGVAVKFASRRPEFLIKFRVQPGKERTADRKGLTWRGSEGQP